MFWGFVGLGSYGLGFDGLKLRAMTSQKKVQIVRTVTGTPGEES